MLTGEELELALELNCSGRSLDNAMDRKIVAESIADWMTIPVRIRRLSLHTLRDRWERTNPYTTEHALLGFELERRGDSWYRQRSIPRGALQTID